MNDTKPFWASRTLWVNGLSFIAAITGAYGLDLGLDEKAQASIVGGVMAVVNIILRLITKSGISAARPPGGITGLLLLAVVATAVLAACAGTADVRWAQAQSTYNEAAKALELYRAPCVDAQAYANAGPEHPLCRIDDATWAVAYPLMQEADRCLKAADARLQTGSTPAVEDSLGCAEAALERLIVYRLSTQGD